MMRPHERFQVNSASYYFFGLFLSALLFPKEAVLMGVLILGFGDPVASLVGQRYGRLKLYGEKSLAGSLAFLASGTLVAFIYTLIYMDSFSIMGKLGLCFFVALVGAAAELFTKKIDDNFTIPVACSMAGAFIFWIV